MFLTKLLSSLIPFVKFQVEEKSMSPYLNPGDLVIILKTKNILKRDVVIFEKEGDYFIKRVTDKDQNKYFLEGDNKELSEDSRKYGWVEGTRIIGKVVYKI